MTARNRAHARQSLGEAALKGAIAALAGGVAMKVVWEGAQRALPEGERIPSPTRTTVNVLASRRRVELTEPQRTAATLGLFTGAMAAWGAVFGMVHSRVRPPALVHGLVLGGLVYAANFPAKTGALPRLGVLDPPGDQSRGQAAVPIAAHAAFGLATAAAFEALG